MSQPTVLIVEDDADTRDMIGRFLELEGYAVETAANGRQALDRLDAGASACVILLDLMMPVMDGWEFRRIQVGHSVLSKIPVIVLSARGTPSEEFALGLTALADAYRPSVVILTGWVVDDWVPEETPVLMSLGASTHVAAAVAQVLAGALTPEGSLAGLLPRSHPQTPA